LLTFLFGISTPNGWTQQSAKAAVADRPASPSDPAAAPETAAAVLERIAHSGLPERGAHDAKVTIVFFDDFQCPYCASMYSTLFGDVMKDYGDRLKVVLQPVSNNSIHPWALHAAINANCLAAQNNEAYWDFTDYVHFNQGQIAADPISTLDKLALGIAEKHRLSVEPLQDCLTKQSEMAIKESYRNLKPLGVVAVPTLFVNNESIRSAVSAQRLRDVIERVIQGQTVSSDSPVRADPSKSALPAGPSRAIPPTSD
jgi:protein-disulfide isomerase